MARRWNLLSWLFLSVWQLTIFAQPIKYRSYLENIQWLERLNETFPDVVQVFVAQDKYDLPFPSELMCNEDKDPPLHCKQYVVHLTNHSTIGSDPERPEVFISGALHGDERVGPVSAMELIALMAKQATAFAAYERNASDTNVTEDQLASHLSRRWIWELVNTRSIYITPMTNAYGYAHESRQERDIDSNRDFIYLSYPDCMNAMTSRVMNELWRDHIFQVAVTFHAGMRAIAYEWGTPNHYLSGRHHKSSEKSPDHQAQFQLATLLSKYAGSFSDGQLYPTGMMNDLVYGVTGGMEDWAYAASWENQYFGKEGGQQLPFGVCKPQTYGGYEASKTIYNNVTHRAFNLLVETSNSKKPDESTLGNWEDLYNTDLDYYDMNKKLSVGHVIRNVRLALMLIEMVQPYVRWISSEPQVRQRVSLPSKNDFSPIQKYPSYAPSQGCSFTANAQVAACNNTNCTILRNPSLDQLKLQFSWEALGSLNVNSSFLQLSYDPSFSRVIFASPNRFSGKTRRHFDMTRGVSDTGNGSVFTTCVDLNQTDKPTTVIYARAVAILDQSWRDQGTKLDAPSPRIPPQSHLVNARTNAAWNMSWNGRRVKASIEWYSPVVRIQVTSPTAKNGSANASSLASEETSSSSSTALTNMANATSIKDGASSWSGLAPLINQTSPARDDSRNSSDAPSNSSNNGPPQPPSSLGSSQSSSGIVIIHSPSSSIFSSGSHVSSELSTSSRPKTAAKKPGNFSQNHEDTSLLGIGYTVLAVGGVVIVTTLGVLYRKVFRSRRKHKRYMNVNEQKSAEEDQLSGDGSSDQEEDDAEEERGRLEE